MTNNDIIQGHIRPMALAMVAGKGYSIPLKGSTLYFVPCGLIYGADPNHLLVSLEGKGSVLLTDPSRPTTFQFVKSGFGLDVAKLATDLIGQVQAQILDQATSEQVHLITKE